MADIQSNGGDTACALVDQMLGIGHITGADIDMTRPCREEGPNKGLTNAAIAAGHQGNTVFDLHRVLAFVSRNWKGIRRRDDRSGSAHGRPKRYGCRC